MDFPRAWEITRASQDSEHDPRCSWIVGRLLCDCHVLTQHSEYGLPPKPLATVEDARALAVAAREDTAAGLTAREQLPNIVEELAAQLDIVFRVRLAAGAVQHLIGKDRHSPARVRAYLVAQGWEWIRQYPDMSSTWHHPSCESHTPTCHLRVLDCDKFSDYAKVTGFLVQDVAEFLCVGELRVLSDIERAA